VLFDRDAGLVRRTGDVARGSLFVGDQLDVACLVEFSNSIGEREDRDGLGSVSPLSQVTPMLLKPA